MIAYFDNSALVDLFQDPQSDLIAQAIKQKYRIYVSAYNVAETIKSADSDKRKQQLIFLKSLSPTTRPLALPKEYLKNQLSSYMAHRKDLDASIGQDQEWARSVLCNPDLADEIARAEVIARLQEEENWFKDIRLSVRDEFDKAKESLGSPPKSTTNALHFARRYYEDGEFLSKYFERIFQGCGFENVDATMARNIFTHCDSWKYYFGAILLGVHQYAVPATGFGFSRQAGSIDTQQCAYLDCADVFITNDKGLLKILKRLRHCGVKKIALNLQAVKSTL